MLRSFAFGVRPIPPFQFAKIEAEFATQAFRPVRTIAAFAPQLIGSTISPVVFVDRIVPFTSSAYPGVVVPIPTLPALSILIRSAALFTNIIALFAASTLPTYTSFEALIPRIRVAVVVVFAL